MKRDEKFAHEQLKVEQNELNQKRFLKWSWMKTSLEDCSCFCFSVHSGADMEKNFMFLRS